MASIHGKNSKFFIDDSAGALKDISSTVKNVSFPQTVETADSTAFQDGSRTFVVGLKTATLSVEGNYDPAAGSVDSILGTTVGQAALLVFEWGPEGDTASEIKYTGSCIITSYETSGSVDGLVEYSAEFQVSGGVTRTTY